MKLKFNPVAWMTTVLTVLIAVDAALGGTGAYPPAVAAWVGAAIAFLTTLLGVLTHGKVTPTARPRGAAGERLVPATMRSPER